MKKIPLLFPEKLCCFVADKMMDVVDDELFYLKADLRTLLKSGNYENPTDLVPIEASPKAIKLIIEALGQEFEFVATDINQELRAELTPQLMKYLNPMAEDYVDISVSDPDLLASIQEVAIFFGERDDKKLKWANNKTTSGRQRLKG
jgi:hypothetical protein